ncbi:MAG: hypothetical protein OEW72_01625 [Gammaproteobacteria bacterium]|nr:hypothetical protein [Gammaproteobacteria bacterium]
MRIVVVGSGASGVHFALSALERGHEVILLDVGNQRGTVPAPDATFSQLKDTLPDPAGYFLGLEGEGVVYPASRPSYYGHPPSKHYVFDVPAEFRASAESMEPMFSFAKGGFAEAWTAGCYAFAPEDLTDFPFDYEALRPHYDTVARRIGVGAADDDLARFFPRDASYLPPLPPDPHSAWLLARYAGRRAALNGALGFYLALARRHPEPGARQPAGLHPVRALPLGLPDRFHLPPGSNPHRMRALSGVPVRAGRARHSLRV